MMIEEVLAMPHYHQVSLKQTMVFVPQVITILRASQPANTDTAGRTIEEKRYHDFEAV